MIYKSPTHAGSDIMFLSRLLNTFYSLVSGTRGGRTGCLVSKHCTANGRQHYTNLCGSGDLSHVKNTCYQLCMNDDYETIKATSSSSLVVSGINPCVCVVVFV